jgi:integrase
MGVYKYTGKKGSTYFIDFYDPEGKRVREKVGPKKNEAVEQLGKRLKEIREGTYGKAPAREVPFDELADEHLKRNKHLRSQSTLEYVVKVLKANFGDRPVSSITERDIDDFILLRRDTPTRWGKSRTGATVNRETNTLRAMLATAARQGLIARNPASRPRMMAESKGRLRYLAIEEANRLLELAKKSQSQDIYPLILIALDTGMRRGEIVNLHWEDIDGKTGQLWVRRSKNGDPRHVPMTGQVREVLSRRPRRIGSPLVFNGNERGKPISNGIREVFVNLLEKAGITDFTFHDLRHTYASHLVMAGVPLYTVGKLLGHKGAGMTARYAHLAPGYLQEAVSVLPDWEGHGQKLDTKAAGA